MTCISLKHAQTDDQGQQLLLYLYIHEALLRTHTLTQTQTHLHRQGGRRGLILVSGD